MDAYCAHVLFNKEDIFINNNYYQNPNQKRPEKQEKNLINEKVRFPQVRLIGPNGDNLGLVSSREAYEKATQYNLDLVCISENANPPVCKILDYGKYKFEAQKRERENKKKQKIIEIKEIRLTPQIGEHDIQTKARQAIEFLKAGNKVKVSMKYRGRQMTHVEVGEDVMGNFIHLLDEYATVEKAPLMEGRFLNATLASKIK